MGGHAPRALSTVLGGPGGTFEGLGRVPSTEVLGQAVHRRGERVEERLVADLRAPVLADPFQGGSQHRFDALRVELAFARRGPGPQEGHAPDRAGRAARARDEHPGDVQQQSAGVVVIEVLELVEHRPEAPGQRRAEVTP